MGPLVLKLQAGCVGSSGNDGGAQHRTRHTTILRWGSALRGRLKSLRRCGSVDHDANACDVFHSLQRLHCIFVVFAESAITAEPSEGSLYNPGQARDLESALPLFDDLQFPAVFAQNLTSQFAAFMSSVSNDRANVGKSVLSHPIVGSPRAGRICWLAQLCM